MLARRNSAAMSDLCPVVYCGFQTVGLKTGLLRIRVPIYAMKMLANETAVFMLIAVLWGGGFHLTIKNVLLMRINLLAFPAGNVLRNRRVALNLQKFLPSANYLNALVLWCSCQDLWPVNRNKKCSIFTFFSKV